MRPSRPKETLQELVSRLNAGAYLPNPTTGENEMAKQLKKFEFKAPTSFGARPSKYNWDQYLDGTIWQLQLGADIEVAPTKTKGVDDDEATSKKKAIENFISVAKVKILQRGQDGIKIQKLDDGVVIQAQGAPDAEKGEAYKAEQRAKIKAADAALKAKKAAAAAAGTSEVEAHDDSEQMSDEDAA